MQMLIVTGANPVTQLPIYGYVHRFLAGARKKELRVPTPFVTRKTGKTVDAFRCVPDGALKPVPVRSQTREAARRLRQQEKKIGNR